MPTAAKLVAAAFFAMTGFLAAEAVKRQMPEGMYFGSFSLLIAAIGVICGWRIAGQFAGRGYMASIGFGFRTSVTIVFWGLLLFSIERMIQRALDMLYKGPVEAVLGIFQLMMELSVYILRQEVLIVLAVGAVVGGIAVEWAVRRWN